MVNDFLPRGKRPFKTRPAFQRPEVARPISRPAFHPPEEVAKHEETVTPPLNGAPILTDMPAGKPPTIKKTWKEKLKSLTKKQWAIIVIIAVLVLGGIGTGIYLLVHKPAKPVAIKQEPVVIPPKPPEPIYSKLTGLQITDAAINDRQVTGIMIENSPDARPQSGLAQAGMIFEAIAEGGITRFLTLWQDTTSDYIGPVRSVRPYYIQWGQGFDAAIAHVGGSAEALQDMKTYKVKDLDQFAGANYFQRITQRYAPHNVYTSIAKLQAFEAAKGYTSSAYTGFAHKADAAAVTPTAKSVGLKLSGFYYDVHYDYDIATNTYKRSNGGKPHMNVDAAGAQTQLSPKVVVALVMPYSLQSNRIHSQYGTIGSGRMYVFQDGTVTEGTWSKPDRAAQFTFTDTAGAPISLNRGQAWITAVGATTQVTYAP